MFIPHSLTTHSLTLTTAHYCTSPLIHEHPLSLTLTHSLHLHSLTHTHLHPATNSHTRTLTPLTLTHSLINSLLTLTHSPTYQLAYKLINKIRQVSHQNLVGPSNTFLEFCCIYHVLKTNLHGMCMLFCLASAFCMECQYTIALHGTTNTHRLMACSFVHCLNKWGKFRVNEPYGRYQ